jgi:hypothetical protein
MSWYRYRTSVIVGAWLPTRAGAEQDAIRAGIAVRDRRQPDGLLWRYGGEIEEIEQADPNSPKPGLH